MGVASIAPGECFGARTGAWREIRGDLRRGLEEGEGRRDRRSWEYRRSTGRMKSCWPKPSLTGYNPLPNHLQCRGQCPGLEAGKTVGARRPLSLTVADGKTLCSAGALRGEDRRGVHGAGRPALVEARELLRKGVIGELRAIVGAFRLFQPRSAKVRNKAEVGRGRKMVSGATRSGVALIFGARAATGAGRRGLIRI